MQHKLLENIQNIEQRFLPVKNILEQSDKYKHLYKGIISIQSNILYKPDILFLGINPGEGAFNEKNPTKDKIKPENYSFPNRLTLDKDEFNEISLDWLKKGVARGEFINGKWNAYDWTDRNKKINNIFPARMVDLLFLIAKNQFGYDTPSEKLINKLKTDVASKIMYTNINPIATKSTTELGKIISLLSKEKELKNHWSSKKEIRITKSVVNNFFRQRTFDLIDILKPKTIVCLGNSVQNELTYKKLSKDSKVNTSEYLIRDKQYSLITFSRKGNWSPLLKEVSFDVQKEIKKRNGNKTYT
jgi:hypothetical protein